MIKYIIYLLYKMNELKDEKYKRYINIPRNILKLKNVILLLK